MHKAVVFAVCCLLMSATAGAQTAREKLKGTSKTTGDFNLANRFSVETDGVSVAGVHSIENLNAFVTEARGVPTQSSISTYKDGEDGVNRMVGRGGRLAL